MLEGEGVTTEENVAVMRINMNANQIDLTRSVTCKLYCGKSNTDRMVNIP